MSAKTERTKWNWNQLFIFLILIVKYPYNNYKHTEIAVHAGAEADLAVHAFYGIAAVFVGQQVAVHAVGDRLADLHVVHRRPVIGKRLAPNL